MIRSCALLLLAAAPALLAQSETAEAPAQPQPARIERLSNGVIVVRGSSPAPRPEKRAEGEPATEGTAAPAASPAADKADKKAPAPPKPPRLVESAATVVLPDGTKRSEGVTDTIRRSEGVTEALKTLQNLNGRTVPYLTDREETLSKSANGEVKERRVQRYDASGQPTLQEVTRIETNKLPDGTVVTTETLYQETLNGRMEPIERKTKRETKSGAVARTTSSTEAPSVNGGFQTVLQEETVERKIGENRAEVETTRSARVGSGLAVVGREQSFMSKSGNTSTTETTVYERNPATNQMTLSARKVGRLTENADGSKSEKVETYGFKTESGATNLNATRPQVQEVIDRRTTVDPSGEVRETTQVRQLGVADASTLVAGPTTEVVVRPTADGESRRTEVYEQGVNGRRSATRVIVEKVEK